MGTPRLNQLFARYRTSGDAVLLGRVFDEAAPGLLRVARRLAKDAAAAEDLLQETFLAAIEHADAWDESRPVGPWLIGILTNRARTARRRAGRDLPLERLEPKESAPPEQDLYGPELESAVRTALQKLPETERAAVGARLFEGLSGAEIAERFGISSGLGRVRLHRGMQRLRAALPSGFSLGTGGLVLPGATLARVKAAVMAEATKAGGAGLQGAAVGSLAGVKFIGVALAMGVLLLVVGRGIWTGGPDLAAVAAGVPTGAVPDLAVPARALDGGVPDLGRSTIAAAEEDGGGAPATSAKLVAQVIHGETGEPVAAAMVQARVMRGRESWDLQLESDGEGRVSFTAPVDFDRVSVQVSPTESTGEARRWVEASDVEGAIVVQVFGGGTFEGRVVDEDGFPVPGAKVSGWCAAAGRDKDRPDRVSKADAQGRFRMVGIGPTFHVLASADGYASRTGFRGELNFGESVSGLELILHRGSDVEGRVVDLDGRPIAGVEITAQPSFGSSSLSYQTEYANVRKLHGGWLHAVTDEDGEFRVESAPATGALVSLDAVGFLGKSLQLQPAAGPYRIELDPGLSLVGEVRLPGGAPAAGASVIAGPSVDDPAAVRGRWTTDGNGHFRINGIEPPTDSPYVAPHYLFVSLPGYAIAHVQPVAPSRSPEGQIVQIQLEPELAIEGHVRWPDGRPAADVTLKIVGERVFEAGTRYGHPTTWEWKTGLDEVRSAADGRFSFGQLGRGSYTLHAMDPADPLRRITSVVQAGGPPLELEMDPAALDGRTLTGRVRSAVTGDPIQEFSVAPLSDGSGMTRNFEAADGSFRLIGLAGGALSLSLRAPGFAPTSVAEVDYPEGAPPVEVEMWPKATLRFRVVDGDGELRQGQSVLSVTDGQGQTLMLEAGGGVHFGEFRTQDPSGARGRIFGLPQKLVTVHVSCGEDSDEFQVDLAVLGDEEVEFLLPRTPPHPTGSTGFMVAYLPGLDPAQAAETFAEFQRAHMAGENPPLESALTMDEIDPVLASFEMVLTHESGSRRIRLTAKRLPSGELELEEFSQDLRKLASGATSWGHSSPRTSPVPDFYVGDWAGVWNVTATGDAFEPYSGQIVIPAMEPDPDRIPVPTFIKVKRR